MRMRNLKARYLFCFYLIFLSFPTNLSAEVWDSVCETAINDLRRAQQEVSSAHREFESAKSRAESGKRMLDLCQGDCRPEREMLNIGVSGYNNRLQELKNALSSFEAAVHGFRGNCLK